MPETIILTRQGPIGRLRLNRPAKLNAQTPQMWRELRELGRELRDDRDLRCLVVGGEGRAFSSGIDLAEITGHALGAGLQLALACDLRIAARTTQLGALEFRYGLLPDLGGTAWLPRLVGPARAKELVFSAARIDAEEALRIGLVNRVVEDADLDATVAALAETIAAQPPLALRHAKRAIDAFHDEERSLQLAAEGQAACLRSEDFVEAGKAFREGRAPVYRGR